MELRVRPLLVPENQDGNLSPGQILLVANVLVRGEKQIVPSLFSFSEQLTVLEFMPANLASKRYLMPNETRLRAIGLGVPLSNKILIGKPGPFPDFEWRDAIRL